MADINNLNSGNSQSSYNNNYSLNGNINTGAKKVNGENSAEYSHSWKRMPRPFGLNVRVPQAPVVGVRTQAVIKKTIQDLAMAPIKPILEYFKDNENIFNGSISKEIESLQKQQKTTIELLQDSDEIVLKADAPGFMMDM